MQVLPPSKLAILTAATRRAPAARLLLFLATREIISFESFVLGTEVVNKPVESADSHAHRTWLCKIGFQDHFLR